VKEFITAARDDLGEVDEDDVIEFKHDGREVRFFVPSTGQQAIMLSMGGRDMDAKAAGTFIALFFEMADHDTQRYLQTRLMDRDDKGFDLDTEGGVFDLFEYISEQWSGKAKKQPSDYQKPQSTTGRALTASTRVKASTSSRSRSRASST
jgi:hypothetical protein